jgi:16S rRNA (cytidine1402-2'-O)-methyltransferase
MKRNPGGAFSRPSSILLAMMAIGMNGQSFTFLGYLPTKRRRASFKNLEKISFEQNQSQIFIETPYRNNKLLEDLLQTLHPETHLCIATDITCQQNISRPRKLRPGKETIDLHKRPTIFNHKM